MVKKNLVIILGLVLILSVFGLIGVVFASVDDDANCNPGVYGLNLYLSGYYNAHASQTPSSIYTHRVCTNFPSPDSEIGFYLSSSSNAHASATDSFPSSVGINIGTQYSGCSAKASCDTGEECIFGLSAASNAHLSICDGSAQKLCCTYTAPLPQCTLENTAMGNCGDGIDNDCDTLIDTVDSDCGGTETSCGDTIDNDGDGLVDCSDVDDCGSDSACLIPCNLDSDWNALWYDSSNNEINSAEETDSIRLIIENQNEDSTCAGNVQFTIREEDCIPILGCSYDSVTLTSLPSQFTLSKSSVGTGGNWNVEWHSDNGGVTNDPEYVFTACLINEATCIESTNELKVSQQPTGCVVDGCRADSNRFVCVGGASEIEETTYTCNSGTGVCDSTVTNTNSQTCSAPAGICVENSNRCIQCTDNSHCPGQVCITGTNQCVACTDNSHCVGNPNGLGCDTSTNQCVACTDNSHCVGNPNGPACNTGTNQCVQCTSSSHCPQDYEVLPNQFQCNDAGTIFQKRWIDYSCGSSSTCVSSLLWRQVENCAASGKICDPNSGCITPLYWADMLGIKIANANVDDSVLMIYRDNAGSSFPFELRESDGGAGDLIRTIPSTDNFDLNSHLAVKTTITPQDIIDSAGGGGDGPEDNREFRFKVDDNNLDANDQLIVPPKSPSDVNNLPVTSITAPSEDNSYIIDYNAGGTGITGEVTFSQTSSDEDDDLKVQWNFGDGQTSDWFLNCLTTGRTGCESTTHSYSTPGVKYVGLTAQEMNRGQIGVDSRRIFVYSEGLHAYSIIDNPIINGRIVRLNAHNSKISNCTSSQMSAPWYEVDDTLPGAENYPLWCYDFPKSDIGETYDFRIRWTLDEGKDSEEIIEGLWSTGYDGVNDEVDNVVERSYLFNDLGIHTVKLEVGYFKL